MPSQPNKHNYYCTTVAQVGQPSTRTQMSMLPMLCHTPPRPYTTRLDGESVKRKRNEPMLKYSHSKSTEQKWY